MKLSFYKISVFVFGVALSLLCENSPSSAQQAANTLPTGGTVTSGSATIAQNNNTMNINQSSQKAIINWSTFNVGSEAIVNFNQPNSQSSTLNRVTSASKSMIDGAINANGTVIFVNPNGVVFGKGAEVHTGSIVATTMNIADQEYLSEKNKKIFEGSANGKIVNNGTITANNIDGYIALMAPQVKNQGVIIANMSGKNSIALVSGEKVTLTFQGEQLLNVNVDASTIKSLIKNKNLIQTNGGQVIIAANAASDLKSSVLVNTGTISADGLNVKGGKVYLTASTINQQGTVTASATSNSSGTRVEGGMIVALANTIKLGSGSKTLATGDNGGGVITLSAAKKVNVKAGAFVDASANTSGNGGSINLDAPTVKVHGKLLANGGNQYGNGGSINIIASNFVTSASAIIKASSQVANGVVGNLSFSMPIININQVFANLISSALDTTNVILNALKDVYFTLANSANNNAAIINLLQGVIIQKTSSNRTGLQLNAEGQIYFAGQVVANEGSLLDVVLTGNDTVSISELAKLVASSVAINSKQGEVNLTGASLTSAGGNINLKAKGDINVVRLNVVANNPIDAGQIAMISTDGSVNLQQSFIQTNGGVGRGGTIFLTANQDVAVFNTNVLANGGTDGGQVVIVSGGRDVNLTQSIVQTNGSTGRGGTILISGANQTLISGTEINAIGSSQGGIIKIGYDALNKNIPFSSFTSIDEGTTLNTSQANTVNDSLAGGFIETSAQNLNLLGKVITGPGGHWLIDPTRVTITASGSTSNGSITNALKQNKDVNIRDVDIVNALNAGTNVSIDASISITNNVGQIGWGSNLVTGNGNLIFTAPDIYIGANITTKGSQTYNGAVSLTLSGASSNTVSFTSNSSITFNSTVDDNGTGHGFKVTGTTITFKENVGSIVKPNSINVNGSTVTNVYGNITANSITFNNKAVRATPSSVFSPTTISASSLTRDLYIDLGIEVAATYNGSTTFSTFDSYVLTGLRLSDSAITLTSITVNNKSAGTTYVTGFTLSSYTSTYKLGTIGQINNVVDQNTTNTVSIAKAPLTVTGATTSVTYSAASQTNSTATITGNKGSDTFTVTGYATGLNAATYADNLSVSSSAIANYNVSYVNGSLTINKATLTVTGATKNVTYNGLTQTNNTATVTGGKGTDFFTVTGYASGTNAGTYTDALVVTSTASANYNINYNNGSLVIGKATLTVTADNKSRVYGDVNPSLTYTVTGYVNNENSSVVTGAPTISTAAITSSNVGSYTITSAANNLSATNYNFTYVNGLLTITKAPLTVTGATTSLIYSATNQTNNTATITGNKGSDNFTVSGYGAGLNVGTYVDNLSVTSSAISNYNVSYINGSLTITKAPLTVTGATTPVTYNGLVQNNNTATITGNKGFDAFTVTGYGTGTNAGTYADNLSISSSVVSNYNVTYVNGSLTINKATITISAIADIKTYDGKITSAAVPTYTGLVSADAGKLTGLTQVFNSANVNGIDGSTLSVNNYSLNSSV